MKVVVFGATGTVGRCLVDQALSQNHQVTALARRPEKIGQSHEDLRVVEGDVLDIALVKNTVQGHDVVLCALGTPVTNKEKLRASGTRNIVRAMEETGVDRLVCLSARGVGDSRDILPFRWKYLLIPLLARHTYADHELQESYVRNSRLDWVIVRPGGFSDAVLTSSYRHGFTAADKSLKLKISRADVADFMLSQLADNTYLRQAPSYCQKLVTVVFRRRVRSAFLRL